jgi:hypothetical protein
LTGGRFAVAACTGDAIHVNDMNGQLLSCLGTGLHEAHGLTVDASSGVEMLWVCDPGIRLGVASAQPYRRDSAGDVRAMACDGSEQLDLGLSSFLNREDFHPTAACWAMRS